MRTYDTHELGYKISSYFEIRLYLETPVNGEAQNRPFTCQK
jgi:hypothetical protein